MTDGEIRELEQDVKDLTAWKNEHDGRIDAWWDAQHTWNEKMEDWVLSLQKAVTKFERRMAYTAGWASGAGAVVGSLLVVLFQWMLERGGTP